MIISQTPFRISFVGGGTDLPDFYQKHGGAVISTAIDKYIYITVKKQNTLHDHKIRLSYSQTENVERVDDIAHPIVRAALKFLKINDPIEITTVSDIPAKTGLGSSSAFTVGLLNALHAFKNEYVSKEQLAQEAVYIEMNLLDRPLGKQDHYASAYGGLNSILFHADESVSVNPILCGKVGTEKLFDSLLLFYTGITRDSTTILSKQKALTKGDTKTKMLLQMKEMTEKTKSIFEKGFDAKKFGHLLHEGWIAKKSLVGNISNKKIDDYYEKGLRAGAYGGKLLGAGGGGFLLFCAPKAKKDSVKRALRPLIEVPIAFSSEGSRIIFYI